MAYGKQKTCRSHGWRNDIPEKEIPMNRLHIKIKDDEKMDIVLNLLKELPFVEIEDGAVRADGKVVKKNKGGLDDLFGLWEKRNVTLKDIRGKAWERR